MKRSCLFSLAVLMLFSNTVYSMKTRGKRNSSRRPKSFGRGVQLSNSSGHVQPLQAVQLGSTSSSLSNQKLLLTKPEFLAALISHTPGQLFSKEIEACAPIYIKAGENSKDELPRKLAYFTVEVYRKLGKNTPKGFDEKSRALSEKVAQACDLTKDEETLAKMRYHYQDEKLTEKTDDKVRLTYLQAKAIKTTLGKIKALSDSAKNDMNTFSLDLEKEDKAIQDLQAQLQKKQQERDELEKRYEKAMYNFHFAMLASKLKEFDKNQLIKRLEERKKELEDRIKILEDDIAYIEKSSESKEEKEKKKKQKEVELGDLKNQLSKGSAYYLKQVDDSRWFPVIKMFQ